MGAHLDTRQLLRKMSPDLRKELFEHVGINDLPWLTMKESNVEPLIEAFDRIVDTERRKFQGWLQDVSDLADEAGTALLVEELGVRKGRVPDAFRTLESHVDRAAWCLLHNPDAFSRALNYAKADGLRSSRTWIKRTGFPKKPIENQRRRVRALQNALSDYYWGTQLRGKCCYVERTRRPSGEDYFFCYLENYPDAGTVLDENQQPVRSREIRVFDNVFVFNSERGELEMYAPGGRKVVDPLQQIFGHVMFDQPIAPTDPMRPAYALDHLLAPDRPLSWDLNDPVESAEITRFRLQMVHRPGEYIEISVNPDGGPGRIHHALAEYLNSERVTSDRLRVKKVTFKLKFTTGSPARSLTFYVGAPSSCNLSDHTGPVREIAQRFLVRTGVIDA